jgi:hypothetical protein
MLRPLAVAIGLALCLSGSSSAYAGTKSVLFKEAGWAWKYLAQELTYKNGKVILSKPIRVDLFGYHYERSELNLSGEHKRAIEEWWQKTRWPRHVNYVSFKRYVTSF